MTESDGVEWFGVLCVALDRSKIFIVEYFSSSAARGFQRPFSLACAAPLCGKSVGIVRCSVAPVLLSLAIDSPGTG